MFICRCTAKIFQDRYTLELANELRDKLGELYNGSKPAMVVNNLHRRKFDANRELPEATFGVLEVEAAFALYDQYINEAKNAIIARGSRGLLFDIHGHSHDKKRAELGYKVTKERLNGDNGKVPKAKYSSIRGLAATYNMSDDGDFVDLLYGNESFGAFLEAQGYDCVPSPSTHSPGSDPYFSGGYILGEFGSKSSDTEPVDAIQIESADTHRATVNRTAYVNALANAIKNMVDTYYIE